MWVPIAPLVLLGGRAAAAEPGWPAGVACADRGTVPPAKPRPGRLNQASFYTFGVTARLGSASMAAMHDHRANCPLCGRENECQFATTSAYKGKCWCAREDFSPDLLARIPEEARNVACVCRRCVVAANFAEARARPLPRPAAGDFYIEGELVVFTAQYHRRRGYCCGSGCRHCPFDSLERELAPSHSRAD